MEHLMPLWITIKKNKARKYEMDVYINLPFLLIFFTLVTVAYMIQELYF